MRVEKLIEYVLKGMLADEGYKQIIKSPWKPVFVQALAVTHEALKEAKK